MKITIQRKITKSLNLILVSVFSICIALTSIADFLNGYIAFFSIVILVTSSILMSKFYKKEKFKTGSFFYVLNLLGLISIPIVRLIGTSFREGYIETLVITFPLIGLIIWNEKTLKN